MSKLYFLILLTLINIANANVFNKVRIEHFKDLTCKKEIEKQLADWNTLNSWTKHIVTPEKIKFMSPTKTLSKWTEIYFGTENEEIRLLSPESVLSVKYTPSCKSSITIKNSKKSSVSKLFFTDADLEKLITINKMGIIYTLGPQMPLSIKGIKEVKAAAKKNNIPITFLIPSSISKKELLSQLKKEKIKYEQYRVSRSMELALRGAFLHLPSVLTYKNTVLDRRARPGHEKARIYAEFFENKFGDSL